MHTPLEQVTTQQAAANILYSLPPPGDYEKNYQPHYPDANALLDAMIELHATEAVTTPRQVDALQRTLAQIALGEIERPITITERCAEPVDLNTPIETLVATSKAEHELILSVLPRALVIKRNCGQIIKPRTVATEQLPDGRIVTTYMGDGINSTDPDHRTPDPTRLVAGALQSRDLEAGLTLAMGYHVPAAHEALSLPYEQSFIRTDQETGKKYSLSGDILWIGKRTNGIDGPHVAMLAEVENPIGVKIGPDSTPEHIADLQQKLNPQGKAGKLVFMLRMGLEHTDTMRSVVAAIRDNAPDAILMYDIHGVTKTAPTGEKIRYTGDIIEDIRTTAAVCREAGLKLHGVHLETQPDNARLECTDEPGQLPTHPGGVDPQLNPRQLRYVLEEVADSLL